MLDIEAFDSMSEEERHRRLLTWEDGTLNVIFQRVRVLESTDAERHLRKGLMLRVMMMQQARVTVRDVCADRVHPLRVQQATDVAIYLNSFYLNLAGGLDNIAWALAYEHELQPNLDEADWESQRFCGLFREEFQTALKPVAPGPLESLDRLSGWYEEVREFRDPAAHRIPLAVVPATIKQDRMADYKEIQAEGLELLRSGDTYGWIEKRREKEELFDFLPVMESPAQGDERIRIAPNQMAYDQTRAVALAREAVQRWFPEP